MRRPYLALKPGRSDRKHYAQRRARDRLKSFVSAPRPSAALIGMSVLPSASKSESNIQLSDQNELPQDAKLTFSVRAKLPTVFGHDEDHRSRDRR